MKAVFIGHQPTFSGMSFALFNVDIPGHPLNGSTVGADTIKRLGIKQLVDKQGNNLLFVPSPKKTLDK